MEKWFRIWKNGLGCGKMIEDVKKSNVKEMGLIIYQIETTKKGLKKKVNLRLA